MAEIKNSPRNPVLGGLSAIFGAAKKGLNSLQFNPGSISPMLAPLNMFSQLNMKPNLGDWIVGEAPEAFDDYSYGYSPLRGGSLQTTRVDPRMLDVAGVLPSFQVAKPAAKAGAKLIHEGMTYGTGPLSYLGDLSPGIIKKEGGQWLNGNIEDQVEPFTVQPYWVPRLDRGETFSREVNDDGFVEYYKRIPASSPVLADNMRDEGILGSPKGRESQVYKIYDGTNHPNYTDTFNPTRLSEGDEAVNRWVSGPLAKYVKNRMGTESDEIRQLADQGITHMQDLEPLIYSPEPLAIKRARFGFPEKGVATTDLGRTWENLADAHINPFTAHDLQNATRYVETGKVDYPPDLLDRLKNMDPRDTSPLEEAQNYLDRIGEIHGFHVNPDHLDASQPWLNKLEWNTPIATARDLDDDTLGFRHLVDSIRDDVSQGLIDPKQLTSGRFSMEAAVRRAHEKNLLAAKAAEEAQLKNAEAMNLHGVRLKEYPETGLKWVDLQKPERIDPEMFDQLRIRRKPNRGYEVLDPAGNTVKGEVYGNTAEGITPEEAMLKAQLIMEGNTMGHCVGGYCDDVLRGGTRILSLRDKKGQPHVTVEVRKGAGKYGTMEDLRQNDMRTLKEDFPGIREEYEKAFDQSGEHSMMFSRNFWPWVKKNRPDVWEAAQQTGPARIIQIKGKGNARPAEEYTPAVQDLIRSLGPWDDDIGDFGNTGLMDLRTAIHHNTNFVVEKEPFNSFVEWAKKELDANGPYIDKKYLQQKYEELTGDTHPVY